MNLTLSIKRQGTGLQSNGIIEYGDMHEELDFAFKSRWRTNWSPINFPHNSNIHRGMEIGQHERSRNPAFPLSRGTRILGIAVCNHIPGRSNEESST